MYDADRRLSSIIEQIQGCISREDMENKPCFQVEFRITDNLEHRLAECKQTSGIYLFEIANHAMLPFDVWFEDFKNRWNVAGVEHRPLIAQNRAKEHKGTTKAWIPLYIGKSKDVSTRIKQHIKGYSTTSSLRLSEHKFLADSQFRVKVIYLADLDNYDIISTAIESQLRKDILPIVGKQ